MRALALVFLLSLAATPAAADWPWPPANSTIPSHVHLVTWNGVTPDAALGHFVVTVRDLANNPVAGSMVLLDFSGSPGVRLASDQMDAGIRTRCQLAVVDKRTGADGTVAFTIMGSTTGETSPAGPLTVKIYADGVLLGSPLLSIFDLDGADGIGANDVSVWLGEIGDGQYHGRGDYDGDGAIGANDLSLLIGAQGTGGSSVGIATFCP